MLLLGVLGGVGFQKLIEQLFSKGTSFSVLVGAITFFFNLCKDYG